MLVAGLKHPVVPLLVAVPIAPVRTVRQGIGEDVVRAMVGHGVNRVGVKRRILVVDAAIGQEDDVVLAGRIEHGVVVDVVVVALDHQSASGVPNDVVVHGAVTAFSCFSDRCVKASPVLDDVVNPVVGDFRTWRLRLHHLHNGTVGLQMANVPHFVVEDLGRITDGQHRRSARQVNGVVGEIHVTSTFVNRDHQALLIGRGPIDGMEVGVVHRVVVRLTRRTLEFNGTTVGVGDRDVVDKGVR